MKRIQSACIYKTIHFQLKDGLEHEAAVAAVRQEAAAYEAGLRQKNVGYRILEEHTQPDGSIRIKIKMQQAPLGGVHGLNHPMLRRKGRQVLPAEILGRSRLQLSSPPRKTAMPKRPGPVWTTRAGLICPSARSSLHRVFSSSRGCSSRASLGASPFNRAT